MIHGDTTRRPSASWTTTETTYSDGEPEPTSATSAAAVPAARCRTCPRDASVRARRAPRCCELRREQLRLDADVRRPPRPPRAARSRAPTAPAGRLLERGGVQLRRRGRGRARARRTRARPRPCAPAISGSASRSSAAASAATSSSPPTGTFSATSSGSSANQPTSLTTSGFPSESVRIALPDVSPIVGARSSTHASHAAISDQSRRSSTYGSRITPSASSPSRSSRPARSKPGASRADEQQPRAGMRAAAARRTRAAAAGCACSRSGGRSSR